MNTFRLASRRPDMRIHRRDRLVRRARRAAGQHDGRPGRTAPRRPRRRRDRGNARRAPGSGTAGDQAAPGDQTAPVRAAPGETVAAAMQLAIALLTAGLDSSELEAWAADALTPRDTDGLADSMARACTWSPCCCWTSCMRRRASRRPLVLQRLAILAEHGRGTPSAGWRGQRRPPGHRRLPGTGREVSNPATSARHSAVAPPWHARRPRRTCRIASRRR